MKKHFLQNCLWLVGLITIASLIIQASPASIAYATTPSVPDYQKIKSFPETKNYQQILSLVDAAFDTSGNLYAIDNFYQAVIKYDTTGQYISHWNVTSPYEISVDPWTNQVYVATFRNKIHVYDDEGNLLDVFGDSGSGNGEFNQIYDIAFDNQYVYISDNGNHRVQVFEKTDWSFVTAIGEEGTGDGQFQYTGGIAVGNDRSLYVSDMDNARIQLFHFDPATETWNYHSQFGSYGYDPGEFHTPYNLVLKEKSGGNELIVLDSSRRNYTRLNLAGHDLTSAWVEAVTEWDTRIAPISVNHKMVHNPVTDDLYLVTIGALVNLSDNETDISKWLGVSNNQFNNPRDIAVDQDGNIYVADTWYHRILKYDPDGNFLTKWGSFGSGDGQFMQPSAIAIDSHNRIYVADYFNDRVQVFEADGHHINTWGSGGLGDGQLASIRDIAIDAEDNLYIVSSKVVQKFDVDGNWLLFKLGDNNCDSAGFPACEDEGYFSAPSGVTVDTYGNIYVSDLRLNQISKFSSDGTFIMRWGERGNDPGQLNYPYHLTTDDMNRIYVADQSNFRIQTFAEDGSFLAVALENPDIYTPYSIEMSSKKLYVADFGDRDVKIFHLTDNPLNDLTATGDDRSVVLNFSAPTDAMSVTVWQSVYDSGTWTTAVTEEPVTETSTRAVVTGLSDDTTYAFYLEVIGGDRAGISNIAVATTNPSGGSGGDPGDGDGGSGGGPGDGDGGSGGGPGDGDGGSGRDPGDSDRDDDRDSDSGEVSSDNGSLSIPAGWSGTVGLDDEILVEIPSGASDGKLSIAIKKLSKAENDLEEHGEIITSVFDISNQTDSTLKKQVTVSLKFDPEEVGHEQNIAIYGYDKENRKWIRVGGKIEGDWIRAKFDDLTKVAVLKEASGEPVQKLPSFSDISGHWAEHPIIQAAVEGIVSGYPDGTFRADRPVTRAEFTLMLVNALQLQRTNPADTLSAFTDQDQIGTWAKEAVAIAQQAGIVTGYEDGKFRPNAHITRAEMAVMVAKALQLPTDQYSSTSFSDDQTIPQWAKGAVEAIRIKQIMEGRGDHRFVANEQATRAECAVILLRVLDIARGS